jgi:hypothetical protein
MCKFNVALLSLKPFRSNIAIKNRLYQNIKLKKNCISNGKLTFKATKPASSKRGTRPTSSKYDAASSKTNAL